MPDDVLRTLSLGRGQPREALVIASPWPYHPTCGIGGGVLCFQLLERLSGRFDLHFLSFDQVPNDLGAGLRALSQLCASVTTLPAPKPVRGIRDRWHQLLQVPRRMPREVRDLHSPEMAAAIGRLVAAHGPAAVILQFPPMAQYVDAAGDAPIVIDVQDACLVSRYREWRRAAAPARRAARLAAWLAWLRYEAYWYARADALLAISENDLGVLRSFLPDVPSFYSPVAAELKDAPRGAARSYIAFVGNFDHAPNQDALEWLIHRIWPLVRARLPNAEFHVAGPAIPAWAGRHADDGVIVRGFVESLDDFYGRARVAVVPYRFGGGTKIKALDAMARGCPVVATTIGSEGLRTAPGVHLLVADDAEGFACAILKLMHSDAAQQTLAEAARAHIRQHFSWDAKVEALVETLRTLRGREPRQLGPVSP